MGVDILTHCYEDQYLLSSLVFVVVGALLGPVTFTLARFAAWRSVPETLTAIGAAWLGGPVLVGAGAVSLQVLIDGSSRHFADGWAQSTMWSVLLVHGLLWVTVWRRHRRRARTWLIEESC